jgi:carbon-monoxide dehydrogenase medium subunit
MLALDAIMVIRGRAGERRMAAVDFFQGIFETALSVDELLVAVEIPIGGKKATYFFHEFARRRGDYAIAGLAAKAVIEEGMFSDLRLALFAVGNRPLLAGAASMLVGANVTPGLVSDACDALGKEIDPQDDQQASGGMRRHLAGVLLARGIAALLSRPELARRAA